MSARRLRIRFAPEARQDIRDILIYTVKQWGKRQQLEYQIALAHAFDRIRDNPHLGRPRDDLMLGVRGFVLREHAILYTIDEDAITVLRVVHTRTDISSALNP
jgi:toxin ParE1/3/4